MARYGAGSCSNLIRVASASRRKVATKISSLKMRAWTMKSGVAAVAAAVAKDGKAGSTSRASMKVANTMTPPASALMIRMSWAKDERSGGCTASAAACARSIMNSGW